MTRSTIAPLLWLLAMIWCQHAEGGIRVEPKPPAPRPMTLYEKCIVEAEAEGRSSHFCYFFIAEG